MELTPVDIANIPDIVRKPCPYKNAIKKFIASGADAVEVTGFPDKPIMGIYHRLYHAAYFAIGECHVVKRGDKIYLVRCESVKKLLRGSKGGPQ